MNINAIFKPPILKNFITRSTPVWGDMKRKFSTLKNQRLFYRDIQYFRGGGLVKFAADDHQPAWTKRSIMVINCEKFPPVLFTFKIGKYQVIVAKRQQKLTGDNVLGNKLEQKPLPKQLPNRLREKAINIITSDIQTSGLWKSYATEVAVHAITKLPNWPKNRRLKIKNIVGNYSEEQEIGNYHGSKPLKLILQNNHYQPIIDGVERPIALDGDCFYHSVLLSLTAAEQWQLLGGFYISYHRKTIQDDHNNPNIDTLRQLLANHLKRNPGLIDEIVKEKNFDYESIVKEKLA
ncbi:MAG: hypothetical protein AB2989_00330 [Candidatus Symbiodolus clandestinus]